MALANYTNLQSAVADFLNRDDLTSVIPDFIALAEARLNRNIRVRQMIDTASLTINAREEALPTDFLEAKLLVIEDTVPYVCESVSVKHGADVNFYRSATAGKPLYYSIVGGNIQFSPTPDATYTGTLTYYQKIPDLATNSTNWLLTSHPDLYLYTTLMQSAPYLKDDERIPVWSSLAKTALDELQLQDEKAQYNASPLMMRPRRAYG